MAMKITTAFLVSACLACAFLAAWTARAADEPTIVRDRKLVLVAAQKQALGAFVEAQFPEADKSQKVHMLTCERARVSGKIVPMCELTEEGTCLLSKISAGIRAGRNVICYSKSGDTCTNYRITWSGYELTAEGRTKLIAYLGLVHPGIEAKHILRLDINQSEKEIRSNADHLTLTSDSELVDAQIEGTLVQGAPDVSEEP